MVSGQCLEHLQQTRPISRARQLTAICRAWGRKYRSSSRAIISRAVKRRQRAGKSCIARCVFCAPAPARWANKSCARIHQPANLKPPGARAPPAPLPHSSGDPARSNTCRRCFPHFPSRAAASYGRAQVAVAVNLAPPSSTPPALPRFSRRPFAAPRPSSPPRPSIPMLPPRPSSPPRLQRTVRPTNSARRPFAARRPQGV